MILILEIILAATGARGPSVIQARVDDPTPEALLPLFLNAVQQFESYLLDGAIITIDAEKARARILPIEESDN
jgi:predicted nuclease of predicted toxin-antitoxin system